MPATIILILLVTVPPMIIVPTQAEEPTQDPVDCHLVTRQQQNLHCSLYYSDSVSQPNKTNLNFKCLAAGSANQSCFVTIQRLYEHLRYCSGLFILKEIAMLQDPFPGLSENNCPNRTLIYDVQIENFKSSERLSDVPELIIDNQKRIKWGSVILKNGLLNMEGRNDSLPASIISKMFPGMRALELNNFEGGTITKALFELDSFRMIGGRFMSLEKDSLRVVSMRLFEMRGVAINGTMDSASIVIMLPCDGAVTININGVIKDLSKAKNNPIVIARSATCTGGAGPSIDLDLSGNNFSPLAPQKILKSIIDDNARAKGNFKLTLDKIECCLESNWWLFDKIWTQHLKLTVDCSDLSQYSVSSFSDEQDLLYKCNKKIKLPIYSIAIIAAVSVIAVVIIVCVIYRVYLMPKAAGSRADAESVAGPPSAGSLPEVPSEGNQAPPSSGPAPSSLPGSSEVSKTNTTSQQQPTTITTTTKPITIVDTRAKKKQSKPKRSSGSSSSKTKKKKKKKDKKPSIVATSSKPSSAKKS